MSHVRARKLKISGADDTEISNMMNDMLNVDRIKLNIAYPRYKAMHDLCTKWVTCIEEFRGSTAMKPFVDARSSIGEYLKTSRIAMRNFFNIDLSDVEFDLESIEDARRKNFTDKYTEMKVSPLICSVCVTLSNLVKYRLHITEDKPTLSYIRTMSGAEWAPYPFALNFIELVRAPTTTIKDAAYIIKFIRTTFDIATELWEHTQSPDIDVDQFITVVLDQMDKLQKQPELSRCKLAFAKIRESVGLMKKNFNGYYRDLIETKNNTIIMQNFVSDVSKNVEADAATTLQFRTIISYYQKLAKQQPHNPKADAIFDRVNDTLSKVDSSYDNKKIRAGLTTTSAKPGSAAAAAAIDPYDEIRQNNMTKSAQELADELA